jgi:hypothetical protein
MGPDWILNLNEKKNEVLLMDHQDVPDTAQNLEGIRIINKVKYLGVTISKDKTKMRSVAKHAIPRIIAAFKGRLKQADLVVKE